MWIFSRIVILIAIDISAKSFRNHNKFHFLARNSHLTLNAESFGNRDIDGTRSYRSDHMYSPGNQRSGGSDRNAIPVGHRKSQSRSTDRERGREFQNTGGSGSSSRSATIGMSNYLNANAHYNNNELGSRDKDRERDKGKDREFYREHSFIDVVDYRESLGSIINNIGRGNDTDLSQALEVGLESTGQSVAATVLSFIQSRKSYSASGSGISRSRQSSSHGQGVSTSAVTSSDDANFDGDSSSGTSARPLTSLSSSSTSLTSAQLSSIILADDLDSDTPSLRTAKRGKDRYSTTATQSSPSSMSGSSNNMLHPHESTLILEYDHLANNSLSAIELLPFVRKRKDSFFLLHWWVAACKHQIISERFQEIEDQARDLYLQILKSGIAKSSSNINPPHQEAQMYGPNAATPIGMPVVNFTDKSVGNTAEADYVEAIEVRLQPKAWNFQPHSSSNTNINSNILSNSHSNYNASRKGKEIQRESAVVAVEQFLIDRLSRFCESHVARVICVGDVHGCIDELRDLLREAQYSPGDLVLLLGDMVAKGPASAEVVRMAREIGSVSVRGNHDFEVIRRNAEESRDGRFSGNSNGGDRGNVRAGSSDNRNVGTIGKISDHHRIARELDSRDLEWLVRLPYMVHSPDLGSLFVHAGVLPQTDLARQSPWVMMNMRSATVDGKVSPRCLHHFPWAAHWSGPLTVYFGHDAARGLQKHEHAFPNANTLTPVLAYKRKSAVPSLLYDMTAGCVYGERLTAILLPTKEIISVPARRAYVDSRKSHSHKSLASTRADASDIPELGAGAMKESPQKLGAIPTSVNIFKFNSQFGKHLDSQNAKAAVSGGVMQPTRSSGTTATAHRTRIDGCNVDPGPEEEFYSSSNNEFENAFDIIIQLKSQEVSSTCAPVEKSSTNIIKPISSGTDDLISNDSESSLPILIANQTNCLDNENKFIEDSSTVNLVDSLMSISEQFASDSLLCEDEEEEDRMVEESALGPVPTLDGIDEIEVESEGIKFRGDRSIDSESTLVSEVLVGSAICNDITEGEQLEVRKVVAMEGESYVGFDSTPHKGAMASLSDIGSYDTYSTDDGKDGDEKIVESTLLHEDELECQTLLQVQHQDFNDGKDNLFIHLLAFDKEESTQ